MGNDATLIADYLTIVFCEQDIRSPFRVLATWWAGFWEEKRGVRIPTGTYEKYGPYAYFMATRENFFTALLRPKDADLPEGTVDIDSFPV